MLLLLKNYAPTPHRPPHTHPMHPPPLPHFLTLVFSSSPFSRLPQSPEFAAGQKAAAEAQPIWNAAPPSWRSEREGGTRLVVNQAAKSTSCLCAQPTYLACLGLLDCNWQHAPCSWLMKYAWMSELGMLARCETAVVRRERAATHSVYSLHSDCENKCVMCFVVRLKAWEYNPARVIRLLLAWTKRVWRFQRKVFLWTLSPWQRADVWGDSPIQDDGGRST